MPFPISKHLGQNGQFLSKLVDSCLNLSILVITCQILFKLVFFFSEEEEEEEEQEAEEEEVDDSSSKDEL